MSNTMMNLDFGHILEVTITDATTGEALDVSTFTNKTFLLKNPYREVTTVTASFKTDGTDGILTYTIQEEDIDQAGTWTIQARITNASTRLSSSWFSFTVGENLD